MLRATCRTAARTDGLHDPLCPLLLLRVAAHALDRHLNALRSAPPGQLRVHFAVGLLHLVAMREPLADHVVRVPIDWELAKALVDLLWHVIRLQRHLSDHPRELTAASFSHPQHVLVCRLELALGIHIFETRQAVASQSPREG